MWQFMWTATRDWRVCLQLKRPTKVVPMELHIVMPVAATTQAGPLTVVELGARTALYHQMELVSKLEQGAAVTNQVQIH